MNHRWLGILLIMGGFFLTMFSSDQGISSVFSRMLFFSGGLIGAGVAVLFMAGKSAPPSSQDQYTRLALTLSWLMQEMRLTSYRHVSRRMLNAWQGRIEQLIIDLIGEEHAADLNKRLMEKMLAHEMARLHKGLESSLSDDPLQSQDES